MGNLKNIVINDIYKVKHFIETTPFCDIYSANELSTSKLVNISIYNASKIARDDLDEDGNLKEIGFLGFLIINRRRSPFLINKNFIKGDVSYTD